MCVNHNEFICRTIYPLGNDLYVVELDAILTIYPDNNQSVITIDSTEISVDSLSPITFVRVLFFGEGCNGAQVSITPDRKRIQIFYPNFFSIGQLIKCKIVVTLHMNIENKWLPLILNYQVAGQALLEANAEAQIFLGCKQLEVINSPYSNNYSTEAYIKLILGSSNSFTCFQNT